jgi:ankyrin repeat protein
VEQIVGQKREMHLVAFEYCIEELQRDMQGEQAAFDERSKRDTTFITKRCRAKSFDYFVALIVNQMREFRARHAGMQSEVFLDDERYRAVVVEMLEVKKMAKSKLRLYLRDTSEILRLVETFNLREAHRRYTAFLRGQLDIDDGEQRCRAEELCKLEGLVTGTVDEENEAGETRLLEGAADGWGRERLCLLKLAGADFSATGGGSFRCNALMAACMYGRTETARALVELNADVSSVVGGVNALMCAALGGHTSTINVLVELNADVNQRLPEGNNPLTFASVGGHTETVKRLLEVGVGVNLAQDNGATALMNAAQGGHLSTVELLLASSADVSKSSVTGATALMAAAQGDHVTVVERLLEARASVDAAAKGEGGVTALILASGFGQTEVVVKVLAASGADVNAVADHARTALMWAASKGRAGAVEALLELKADPGRRDEDGKTTAEHAREAGHGEIVEMLSRMSRMDCGDAVAEAGRSRSDV